MSSLIIKRTYKEFMAQDLAGKLRSKKDFYMHGEHFLSCSTEF